jgi:hypothetical protein
VCLTCLAGVAMLAMSAGSSSGQTLCGNSMEAIFASTCAAVWPAFFAVDASAVITQCFTCAFMLPSRLIHFSCQIVQTRRQRPLVLSQPHDRLATLYIRVSEPYKRSATFLHLQQRPSTCWRRVAR